LTGALAVNAIHALAHSGANIWLSFLGNAFVVVVILIAPLVSLFLFHTARLEWLGALLLFLSMLAAFLFGVWNHFLLSGSDNIWHVPPGVWQCAAVALHGKKSTIEEVFLGSACYTSQEAPSVSLCDQTTRAPSLMRKRGASDS